MRKSYMPVKVAEKNVNEYMSRTTDRKEYRHLVGSECKSFKCPNKLPGTIDHYEMYGNYCQECCMRLRPKRLSEEELDKIFRGKQAQLYNDLYGKDEKENNEEVIKRVRKELGLKD